MLGLTLTRLPLVSHSSGALAWPSTQR